MQFITLDAFKAAIGVDKIEVKFNPESGKIFGVHSKGTVKVQQSLNSALPIRYMYEEEKFSDGCIANVKELDTRFTL